MDRYLEHARIFVFYSGGEQKIYLSSADWMTRNLSYRIETSFPIYEPGIKQTLLDILDAQLNDNVKARLIDKDQKNRYSKSPNGLPVQSQLETYYYFKRQQEQYSEVVREIQAE